LKPFKASISRPGSAGFTLIEIMLAILIFAIVVTTILTSFNMVFSSTPAIEESIFAYEMAANCLLRITEDLKSIYITPFEAYTPPDMEDDPDPYRIAGGPSAEGNGLLRLRFTSLSHLPLGKDLSSGIAEIVYYLQEDEQGQLLLRRSDTLYPYQPFEAGLNHPVLCEHVRSLIFTYYDREGESSETWDSDHEAFNYATPAGIGIALTLDSIKENDADGLLFETRVALPVIRKEREK
jgi:general secretion pathway protein J